MKAGNWLRDLRWILPLSLALGALLSALQPGQWWLGVLGFTVISIVGFYALAASLRQAAGGRALALIVALALTLRLLAGIGLTLGLPQWGYEEPQQKAGYVFYDSYRRDAQAWELARSDKPLWIAFDKTYAVDQYGGLLALDAAAYRYLSPDAQRPLLIILLGAFAAALGVPFLWRAARRAWDESIAWPAAWFFALYPESILLGSAQMREPFLLTFTALILWGFVQWQYERQRGAWAWLAFGMAGILLLSPGIVFILLIVFAGWYWILQERRIVSWRVVLIAVAIGALAGLLFAWSVKRDLSPGAIIGWFMEASRWDVYLLAKQSGWVELIFEQLPAQLHFPFVAGYGMLQPVLPATLIEPTLPIWRIVNVLRAAGWYTLLPLLVYGWLSAFKVEDRHTRALWLWLGLALWFWIVVSAVRAGGDAWDNPRYRTILLAVAALIAAQGWTRRRAGWFVRIVVVEGVFLAFFTEWYLSRYIVDIPKLSFFTMLAWIIGLGSAVLIGSWAWDIRRARRA